jgi:hypothetical protein
MVSSVKDGFKPLQDLVKRIVPLLTVEKFLHDEIGRTFIELLLQVAPNMLRSLPKFAQANPEWLLDNFPNEPQITDMVVLPSSETSI